MHGLTTTSPGLPSHRRILVLVSCRGGSVTGQGRLLHGLGRKTTCECVIGGMFPGLEQSRVAVIQRVPRITGRAFRPMSSISRLLISERRRTLPSDRPSGSIKRDMGRRAYRTIVSRTRKPKGDGAMLTIGGGLLCSVTLTPGVRIRVPLNGQ